MDSKPKLVYFKAYGRGEPTRLLLSHLKIDYEEEHVDFPPTAEQKAKSAFGSFPYLMIDGKQIGQSRCIVRYLAAKAGLYPTEPYDIWRMESLVDHFADLEMGFYKVVFTQDKEEQAKEAEKFGKGILTTTLQILENRLKENSSQEYLVNDKLTPADVVFNNFIWSMALNPANPNKEKVEEFKALLAQFPTAEAYFNKRKADFPRLETRDPSPM